MKLSLARFARAATRGTLAALAAAVSCITNAFADVHDKPTIVLVHGAFAESASWDGVVRKLQAEHYTVFCVANPLRGVKSDSAYVAGVIDSIHGPIVLVGHSYGGSVISEAAYGKSKVKSLVFVAAFAPDVGESAIGLSGKFPGGTLAASLASPVPLLSGAKDLYIRQDRFAEQFAADVPLSVAHLMAAAQRPIADNALAEAETDPAWKTIPSYFVYGTADKNIPAATQAWMAERAHAIKTVVVSGASHVVMVSKPDVVADLIDYAALH